ncbi:hypothetical protein PNOK_0658600 [Pyrrhoderma noxium]|uniref:Uncharacterized protein n=1 Tax=Pyrrhoderma noxium TaxID=2282107 RepID=A0A286UET7_9AGAM|nr:hypothetical protein PNOK_0658600 [Pyrrhoderma noxium]
MLSNKLLIAASILLTSLVSVRADWTSPTVSSDKYYTIYSEDLSFLDSTNSKITTQSAESVSDITSNKGDKGLRFRFPDGIPGKVICEAHMGHYVGYDSDKGTWRTDISESDSGKLAEVSYFTDRDADKKYIQIGVGGYYISTNAQRTSHAAPWQFDEIEMV